MENRSNPDLPIIREGFLGNPYEKGRFTGQYASSKYQKLSKVFKWLRSKNPREEEKRADPFRLIPREIVEPSIPGKDSLVWLGHATFHLTIGDTTIVTDPVLGDLPRRKRLVRSPIPPDGLRADILAVSHGHYDHLDRRTIRALRPDAGPSIRTLLPLDMGRIVRRWNPALDIQEAGWYQRFETEHEDLLVFMLPAYHWHRRVTGGMDTTLWGSYLFESERVSVYFAGDTGACTHFERIASEFRDIDYALLPIGAYDPPYMMEHSHLNPKEAVDAFQALGARKLIPMHYGTYDLSDEPLGEPLALLRQEMEERGLSDRLMVPDVGERVTL